MSTIEEIPETATTDSRHRHAHIHWNLKPVANSGAARKILFVFLKWSIMACILAVFLLFIGVAAVVVVYFFFANIAFRHNRRRRSIDPAASIRDLLPSVRYAVSEQSTHDCAICLEGFKEGESCRKLPDCTHLFHSFCVDSWLVKKPNCPICRTAVRLNRRPSGSMNDEEWGFWWNVSIGD